MKVLIIDDDQLTSTTWSMGLKSAGYEVINASNGQDGINLAKSQKPNLVLLDQIMPDMLGEENIGKLAEQVSGILQANPDKTIYVDSVAVEAGIRNGMTAAVVGLDGERAFNGEVHGFARMQKHERELDDDGKVRDVLEEGVLLDLNNAIEVGSMLGHLRLGGASSSSDSIPTSGQGSRALSAITHLASWEYPQNDTMAATNQLNGKGAGAVVSAGGRKVGYKTTTRLVYGEPLPGEPKLTGPVTVDIYHMRPTGEFAPSGPRRR